MSTNRKIRRLVLAVESDLKRRVSLSEAASHVGLDPTYLSRRFHQIVGANYSEWNRAIRIAKAKIYLEEDELTITQIASRVGYQDVTTFERNFRKSEGISPRDYRARRAAWFQLRSTAKNADK